jgi:glucose-6-phosphate 1-epimerase
MASRSESIDFHGLAALRIVAPDAASAVVLLHGAQLVSWVPAGGEEQLYLSERATFQPGTAVRGGVPVIFPQFSKFGALPRHGFARTQGWKLEQSHGGSDFAGATFTLRDSEQTRALWPHAFSLELTISLGGDRLDIELAAQNPSAERFGFTCALHTYLRVAEIESARLYGLRDVYYRDYTDNGREHADSDDALAIARETDRVYFAGPEELMLREPRGSLAIRSTGFTDTVVWNPWKEKCRQLADMPPEGFRHMLCVEAAVATEPIKLNCGEEWWGRQTLIAYSSPRAG